MFWRRKRREDGSDESTEPIAPPIDEPPAETSGGAPVAGAPGSAAPLPGASPIDRESPPPAGTGIGPLDFAAAEAAAPPPIRWETEDEAKIEAGLERTRGGFMSRLHGMLRGSIAAADWDEVEETLIGGDVGAEVAAKVVERAQLRRDAADAEAAVRAELTTLLVPREHQWLLRPAVAGQPAVVLVVGVNGTGKTTTIGKLAHIYRGYGRTVLLAAADTFRAAAIDQLKIWADRSDSQFVSHAEGADPAAVVFDSLDAAVARNVDVVFIDTAGRLHTKTNLMDELAKIRRVIDRRLPGSRPEVLFVLDATTGQNGLAQAKVFNESVGLSGIVLTKLDSTAKGGIVFAIEDNLKVPVRFVGVGEKLDDLISFDPTAFVKALFE